jgi:hypothetical protein
MYHKSLVMLLDSTKSLRRRDSNLLDRALKLCDRIHNAELRGYEVSIREDQLWGDLSEWIEKEKT